MYNKIDYMRNYFLLNLKFLAGGKCFGELFGKYLIIRQILQTSEISKNHLNSLWLGSKNVKVLFRQK